MYTRFAYVMLPMLTLCGVAWAENDPTTLKSFEETFKGKGKYATSGEIHKGFDTPYWALSLTGDAAAELSEVGLKLSNEGDDGLSQAVLTRHIGCGSFEEVIHLHNFALGPLKGSPADSFAQLILIHTTDSGGHFQITFIENDRIKNSWWMSVIQDGQLLSWRESKKLSTSVEAGKDIALKVSWDQEDKRVSIVYDRDTKTDKNRKVTLAEFKYAGAPMLEGSVSLILQRMNKGGSSAATLTHWQVAPAKKK